MQDGSVERTGCFVYLVLQPVRPRLRPSELSPGAPGRKFLPGEMVAVSEVRTYRNKHYLRLSDGGGWLPVESTAETTSVTAASAEMVKTMVQELSVDEGLWSFYVDNSPAGQALRRHPIDSTDMHWLSNREPILYQPMQRIYCDRRVTHDGISFYRVQGTDGWVFDQRDGRNMLLDTDHVQLGIFCFQAMTALVVRLRCTTSESPEVMSTLCLQKGEVICVDAIRQSSKPGCSFLRLADGSGWLFTHEKEGKRVMNQLEVELGSWELKILNFPVGLQLRRHPVDRPDIVHSDIYPPNTLVQADARVYVRGESDVIAYYHVRSTTGWIFDRRRGQKMVELLSAENDCDRSTVSFASNFTSKGNGWSADFVRGVAASVERIHETNYSECGQVLCFETDEDIQIIVYCGTRTVGIKPDRVQPFIWYRNCNARQLWTHLRKDLVQLVQEADHLASKASAETRSVTSERASRLQEREEELRNKLLLHEAETKELNGKRLELLAKIRTFDLDRAEQAEKMRKQVDERFEEIRKVNPEGANKLMRENMVDSTPKRKDSLPSPTDSSSVPSSEPGLSESYQHSFSESQEEDTIDSREAVRSRINDLLLLRSEETQETHDFDGTYTIGSGDYSLEETLEGEETFEDDYTDDDSFTIASARRRITRCRACRRFFAGKAALHAHCRAEHNMTCEDCQEVFASLSELQDHRHHDH